MPTNPNPLRAAINQKKDGDAVAGPARARLDARVPRIRGGSIQDEADPISDTVPTLPVVPVKLLQANEPTPMRLKLLKEGHTTSRMFPWLVTVPIRPSSQQEPLLKTVGRPPTVRVPAFRMSLVE